MPSKAVIFEPGAFSDWYCLYYDFGVRSWTHCFGVMLQLQIQALNWDPQILCCVLYETNTPKDISQYKTSKFNHSFSRQSLFKSNTVTRFSLLQRSVTSKKVQRNGKPFWVNCFLLKVVKPRGLFHFIVTFNVASIIVKTDNEKMFAVVLCQRSAKQRESENQHNMIKIIH